MKRNVAIVLCTFSLIALFQVCSFTLRSDSVQPLYGGLSNDPPAMNNCAHCHSFYGAPIARNSQFILKISQDSAGLVGNANVVGDSFKYTPNYTQWVSIELTGANTNSPGSTPEYGFQCTALRSNDSMAGKFILVDPKTSMQYSSITINGPQPVPPGDTTYYVGHKNADATQIWYFKWTAPDSSAGPVTFYYSGNLANGNAADQPEPITGSEADTIFVGQVTVYPGASSTLGIGSISNIANVSVYPIPFSDQISANIYLHAPAAMSITLLSLEGQSLKDLYSGPAPQGHFSRSFDISDIAAGVYLVRIQSGGDTRVIKVMKL